MSPLDRQLRFVSRLIEEAEREERPLKRRQWTPGKSEMDPRILGVWDRLSELGRVKESLERLREIENARQES